MRFPVLDFGQCRDFDEFDDCDEYLVEDDRPQVHVAGIGGMSIPQLDAERDRQRDIEAALGEADEVDEHAVLLAKGIADQCEAEIKRRGSLA